MNQAQVEIGQLWLHLPSGAAGIHGFLPGQDRGAEVGGVMRSALPIGQGGSVRLFEGLDPMRHSTTEGVIVDLRYEPRGFDEHGFDWAGRSTSDVQQEAERHGWKTITRRQVAQRMSEQGYLLHPRRDAEGRAHFHQVLWADQVDDLTWHVREGWDGVRFTAERCVFVERPVPVEQPAVS